MRTKTHAVLVRPHALNQGAGHVIDDSDPAGPFDSTMSPEIIAHTLCCLFQSVRSSHAQHVLFVLDHFARTLL